MFGLPNGSEWIILLVIILFVFGPGRLPQARREPVRSIEDRREMAPPADEPHAGRGELLIFGLVLAVAAGACILTLVAAQNGWV